MSDDEAADELAATEAQVLAAQQRLEALRRERAERLPGRPGLVNVWPSFLARLRRQWERGHGK